MTSAALNSTKPRCVGCFTGKCRASRLQNGCPIGRRLAAREAASVRSAVEGAEADDEVDNPPLRGVVLVVVSGTRWPRPEYECCGWLYACSERPLLVGATRRSPLLLPKLLDIGVAECMPSGVSIAKSGSMIVTSSAGLRGGASESAAVRATTRSRCGESDIDCTRGPLSSVRREFPGSRT